ncbi:MAG: hypothetical protein CMN44_10675 [SAR116 cluster bacterium]|nr:hypothetical protein [SAR116 cluster bacterium]RPH07529.1 MAG: DUF3576 domain-containing protein [Alphaproteobacteria bacterium TMED54]|tara:strand:- start:977 stop:1441 length:465 start_codon:yes stop_codon:yes gene_type:complete
MKLIYITFISIFFFSCASNNEIATEKPEPGLFSKDQKKGISITDFLNRDQMEDSSFYVNSFLWRASLDVLSIGPFQSTDAFGGIIITEWFKKDNKEIKLTALIKSRELRSEGINVKVFIKNNKSEIFEDLNLATKIENLILTKARSLRIQNQLK